MRMTMAKILCVLYDDPVSGYPPEYARDGIPAIQRYPGGFRTPTPKSIDFTPGELLGCVSGELGLRKFLEGAGHTFVVTSDKDGSGSTFEKELVDADIVISQPFWPAYMTAERLAKAKRLRAHPALRTYPEPRGGMGQADPGGGSAGGQERRRPDGRDHRASPLTKRGRVYPPPAEEAPVGPCRRLSDRGTKRPSSFAGGRACRSL